MDPVRAALAESRPVRQDRRHRVSKTMILPMPPLRPGSPLPAVVAAGWLALGGVAQGASQGPAADGPYTGTPPRALFRGMLSRDADRLLLAPCGGAPTLRVRDVSTEVIITAAITDLGFDERGSLYLEAYGFLRDDELWIDRLNRAGIEMACPQDVIRFRAQGNEPGWSLASGPSGVTFTTKDGVILNAPPLPLSWRWPGDRPDRAEALLVVATEGAAFEAELAPRICRDTMSDAVFGFTAKVRLARPEPVREFEGCAFLGSESLPGER
jgi:uncharacterized membrane protein